MPHQNELQDDREDVQRRRNIRRLGSSPPPSFQTTGVQASPPSAPPAPPSNATELQGLRRLGQQAGPDLSGPPGIDAGVGSASIGDVADIGRGALKGAAVGSMFGGLGTLGGIIIGGILGAQDAGLDPDLEQQMAEQAIGGKPDFGGREAGTGSSSGDQGQGPQATGSDVAGQGSFRQGGLVPESSEPGLGQPTQATVHEGEFVMSPEAVRAIGSDNLSSLNRSALQGAGRDLGGLSSLIEQQAAQNLAPEEFAELQSLITPRLIDLVNRAFGAASGVALSAISGPGANPSAGAQPVGANAALPPSPQSLGVTNTAGPLSRGALPFRPQNSPPSTPLRRLGGPAA